MSINMRSLFLGAVALAVFRPVFADCETGDLTCNQGAEDKYYAQCGYVNCADGKNHLALPLSLYLLPPLTTTIYTN